MNQYKEHNINTPKGREDAQAEKEAFDFNSEIKRLMEGFQKEQEKER